MLKKEEQLKKEIAELLQRAEQADGDEDAKYGSARRGDELPKELQRREDRLERIEAARKKLEAEAAAAKARERREQLAQAQEEAEQASDEKQASADKRSERARRKSEAADTKAESTALDASMPTPNLEPRSDEEIPSHQVRADKDGTAKDKAQRNFTDPDSRIQKTGDGYIQGYNAQAVVDAEHQVIVAEDLSNQPPDNEYLIPLLKQVEENCGEHADKFSADSGYWSERNDQWCEDQGIDRHIAAGRLKHDEKSPPARGRMPKNLDRKGKMRRKLRTQKGREIYKMRKAIVEPVFGQMKGARGLRHFMLRGTDKVRAEWSLWCTTHNILKLFRASVTVA